MADFRYVVTIEADTDEQAQAVIQELCGYDYINTDLKTFNYEASWRPFHSKGVRGPVAPAPEPMGYHQTTSEEEVGAEAAT